MKDLFSNVLLAYRAEHIKLKGTAFYILSAIIGILCPLLYFTVLLFGTDLSEMQSGYYYREYLYEILTPFVNFFFPLLLIINVSRITQFDHRNGGWQLMELQPLKRSSIYFSKVLVVITSALISITSLVVASFICGFIITFIKDVPENISQSFEAVYVLQLISRLLMTALFLIAFQYVISSLIPSFIWSIMVGFAGLLTFLFLNGLSMAPNWLPYDMISRISRYQNGSDLGYWFTYSDILSIVLFGFVSFLGFQWYRHKNFRLAFLTRQSGLKLTIVILVTLPLVWYILKPNVASPHNRTLISGKFDSDQNFKEVKLVNGIDTIAVIPVTDSNFSYATSDKISFASYTVYTGKINFPVVLGENDSVFIKIRFKNNKGKFDVLGTRMAENQSQLQENSFSSLVFTFITNNQYLDQPGVISDLLYEEWEEQTDKKLFTTVDNYVAREDFIDRNLQITTALFLNQWNDYRRRRAVMFDTTGDVVPEKIRHMISKVSLRNEALLDDSQYTKYVLFTLTSAPQEKTEESKRQLDAIMRLEDSKFKDKLLYFILFRALYYASDDAERENLLHAYAGGFSDMKYRQVVFAQAEVSKSLGRGKPAPYFTASTLGGTQISLKDLEGKLTVIDVWASWCGPCKQQSPYFERMAMKYADKNVQFVALSTDESVKDWLIDAKAKSDAVMQLHVSDINQFSKNYNVQSIPRYLLIDSGGNLLNADLPGPTDSNFEIILKTELGIK